MQLPDWLHDQDNALLLVAMLLCMWLWLIVRRREEVRRQPVRPAPLSPEELARTVFRAARGNDLHTYRDLFLNGAEASDELGEAAAHYLEARSTEVLSRSLRRIAAQLPPGAVYDGVVMLEDEHAVLSIRSGGADPSHVDIGIVIQHGSSWRLFGPAREPAPPLAQPSAPGQLPAQDEDLLDELPPSALQG